MSKLNKDVLFLIFEELQNDSKFLFPCLMVNRLWCETVIPVLWKEPWHYTINYRNKISLYSIITSYLSNDVKESLTKKGIKISSQSLAFDYLSFCRSINVKIIDEIISIGSSSEYNRFLLQEEIYSFLIKKCLEIKYLNMCGTYELLVHLPEAKDHLESLCELTCDTSIDPKYFYRISHICQQIQRIIIINNNFKVNHGTTKLIEFQKNLKYFKWKDDFNSDYYTPYVELLEDPYTEIFHMLRNHANTLNHFEISIQYDYYDFPKSIHDDYDYTFLQYTLLDLHNLKVIEINSPIFLECDDFEEELEMVAYRNLEILEIDLINIYQAACMINKSFSLRELRIHDYYLSRDWFIDDSLDLIRAIHKNCILIEYLTIPVFPLLTEHFIEFEKLLKNCQKLRSLHFKETYYEEGKELEFGEYLSDVLIREASTNLREIGIPYDIEFSLENLRTFFEKWKGRPAITILIDDLYFYRRNDSYRELISKYKIEGVIKHINV
ncbi:hypothetical protein RclHR1_07530004 [Rhizophagus clarus]|uniref:F-box domain-containing protein n=1 Tax=Rhizophagus clarus TaxID=94130 RepID=A0A2Z6S927_9GLOM|nr:hypothetical protein RclHR1_07530004 [Rhizophagus clarus]GES86359.1 hypothetical protein GLOIN_2v1764011 [Rhizophagus clarus]